MSMFSFFTNTATSILALSVIVNASINNGVDLKILPLGASITWGQDSSDGNGYRLDLRNLLEAQGYGVTYVGSIAHGTMSNNLCEAYPGYTISEVDAKALASGAYNSNPDIVLIHLGTNDCASQRQPIATAPQRFETLLSHLRAASPDALILMSSLIHNNNPAIEACLKTLNTGLAAVAQSAAAQGQTIQFVDMVDAVPWSDLSPDGTHPTDAGYAIMAQTWSNAILGANLANSGLKAQVQSQAASTAAAPSTLSTSVTSVAVAPPATSHSTSSPVRTSSTISSSPVPQTSSATSIVSEAASTTSVQPEVISSTISSTMHSSTSSSSSSHSSSSTSSTTSSTSTRTVSLQTHAPSISTTTTIHIASTGRPTTPLTSTTGRPVATQPYVSSAQTLIGHAPAAWASMIVALHLFALTCMFGC